MATELLAVDRDTGSTPFVWMGMIFLQFLVQSEKGVGDVWTKAARYSSKQ
jgi:hypothetical protein